MESLKSIVSSMLSRNINDNLNRDKSVFSILEKASYNNVETPIELHRKPEVAKTLDVQSWLPMAAEEYAISPNISDYVVVPVIIMPSDLPNRNSVSFPYETLLRFNPGQGRLNYKSWTGKPTFSEHAHTDISAAKGIVFDTYLTRINNTSNIFKVCALCGFDRTKDRELANQILDGTRKSYSMGAFIGQYECSICGDKSKQHKLNTECGHVRRGKPEFYRTERGILPSYLLARISIEGFEISSVKVPAWSSATNSQLIDMAKV